MSAWETLFIDRYLPRDEWGPGAWEDEPDLIAWRYRELACVIRRVDFTGSLCGYVRLPNGHPYYGRSLRQVSRLLEAHGGVTFAGFGPTPGWWIGFDAAHAFDVSPRLAAKMRALLGPPPGGLDYLISYKTIGYVRREIESLADQILSVGCPRTPRRRANKADARDARLVRKLLVRWAGGRVSDYPPEMVSVARAMVALAEGTRVPRSMKV